MKKKGNKCFNNSSYINLKVRGVKMSKENQIRYIPLDSIKPNPYQPRRNFSKRSLEELSQSIRSYGVIQPISVREISEDKFELIAGERRLRASKMAELTEVPAIVVVHRDKESAIIAMIENLQREDLNFIEEAEGYNNLILDHNFTQQDLAKQIGKSQSTIANKIRLLKLPNDIRSDLIENNLTERHGRALLKLPDDDLRRDVLEKTIKNDLNVNSIEKLIEDILDKFREIKDQDIDEDEEKKQSIKSLINIRIYINTIKKAYEAIKNSGMDAKYSEVDKEDYYEVTIKIPKK